MRKLFVAGAILSFVFLNAPFAEAAYTAGVAQKFSRGVGNIVYAPAEIFLQVSNEMTSEDYVYAAPKGLLKGLFYAAGRLVVGAYEVVTFFVPQDPIIPNFNEA